MGYRGRLLFFVRGVDWVDGEGNARLGTSTTQV